MGIIAHVAGRRGKCRSLLGKLREDRSPGRPGRSWEDNIQICLVGVGCADMDWIDLTQNRER